MVWSVRIYHTADKQLKKIDKFNQRKILDYLYNKISGSDDPRKLGKPLKGKLKGYWRYRLGDYRIACKLDDNLFLVLVVRVGHRKEIYK